MNNFEQGQRGFISNTEENLVNKEIPKIYLNKERINVLINKNIPNVVRYISFKENPDGTGNVTMEKLEDPNFSKQEKRVIEFLFSEIEKNLLAKKLNTKYQKASYESCILSLRNYFEQKINDFKNTEYEKDFIDYKKLLKDERLTRVFKDAITGFNNLLENNIFFDDQKAEHVLYSKKEDSYKLIDVI